MKLVYTSSALLFFSFFSCQNKSTQQEHLLFKDSLGHTIRQEDLADADGSYNFEIIGSQHISEEASALHEEARILGQAGDYDKAITTLEKAAVLQPEWPYPIYDLAYTYYLKGDFDNALKYYRKTDSLSPQGFFTSKVALYTLEEAAKGKIPKDLYLNFMKIEWADSDELKARLAKDITEKFPDYAPAWKELAFLTEDSAERMRLIEVGLSKDPDPETKGMLLINKASLLDNMGKHEEAIVLLGDLIFFTETTSSNVEMARMELKLMTQITKE